MSGEFMTDYSVETAARACSAINRKIHQAGSLPDYLLEVQAEQARTAEGRAELLRLQRVSAAIASPLAATETPESQAFYQGVLLSSALLTELTNPGKFQGGTLAHNRFWYYYNDELQARDKTLTPTERYAVLDTLSEFMQGEAYELATEVEGGSIDTFRDFADEHLYSLYSRDEDLFCDAQIGFWTPLQEVYEPAFADETSALLAYYPAPETNYHSENTAPSPSRVEEIVGEAIPLPQLHTINKEREKITRYFNELRAGFGSLENYLPDETARIAMIQHQEHQLNSLNRHSEFFAQGDIMQVTGAYHCFIKDGEDMPQAHKIDANTEVIGEFDSLVVIDVPSVRDFNRAEHPAGSANPLYAIEKIPTPAILLRDPTYIQTVEDEGGESMQTISYTEDTTIAVPLLYKSARIAKLL